jgi:protein-S-isoprenylcysteine O-methyltransferase Ste14
MRARLVTWSGLWTAFTNVALATVYLAFAYAHVVAFWRDARASLLLLVVFETFFAVFLLVRREATDVSMSAAAWISTTVGTFTPLLLRPTAAEDLWQGQTIQVAGLVLALSGLASLNRSVGLLPADRGVCCSGPFRFIRHPLYSAYLVMHLGYVTTHLSLWNIAVVLVTLGAQVMRLRGEEKLLSRNPVYVEYMARTRWRLVPLVF